MQQRGLNKLLLVGRQSAARRVTIASALHPATHPLPGCETGRQLALRRSRLNSLPSQQIQQLSFGGRRRQLQCQAAIEADGLVPLGLDCLTFLASTVLVIPLFKSVKASPVLGFLFSGIVLGQLG